MKYSQNITSYDSIFWWGQGSFGGFNELIEQFKSVLECFRKLHVKFIRGLNLNMQLKKSVNVGKPVTSSKTKMRTIKESLGKTEVKL